MQLLTIEQHKLKTAKERANQSSSTYPLVKSYNSNSTYNSNYNTKSSTSNSSSPNYYSSPSTSKTPSYSTPSSSSSSRVIHTGPRGGQYYINSNGNKTYVKK